MSTRSIIRVFLNGEYRVCQYVQSDGYPEWRGVEVLKFMRKLLQDGREQEFRDKISAARTMLQSTTQHPRVRTPSVTFTGARYTSVRGALLEKCHEARFLPISEENPYGTRMRSWREAIEHLLAAGELNDKEAAYLAVAGRDSGIGALEWLMAYDTPMTFYMPDDLVKLPRGGGDSGSDMIWGDYIIDLDARAVGCGYHQKLYVTPFDLLVNETDEQIKKSMEHLEKEAWK
ncbi:MAG: hypothetical protein IJI27_05295 [Oscillospiraceae bacterium]|nr:hypothetical protein [Oscillospiraceae bacterium]